ncbi:MAG: hypothetical protein LBI60_03235, partial [Bacteroidales bacterium]|nr:hypothetical protein [Bacteroidales bacterium]
MKNIFSLVLGMALAMSALNAQVIQTWTEDFDNTSSFVATPTGSWIPNSVYYFPNLSTTNPKSCLGMVPTHQGNIAILETPVYDCADYDYVLLKFNHICKVSPNDAVSVEYRINSGSSMGAWDSIPVDCYLGSAANYWTKGFNAASYPLWEANDSTAFPAQSWWKEESFDLKGVVNGFQVQFRFVIKRGSTSGTQVSYGWLLDDFQLFAAKHQLHPPYVSFVAPFVRDTVYGVGAWEITAKVKTGTSASIETPKLKYTAIYHGVSVEDSVVMSAVEGDSLWKAKIPPFVAGTKVIYSITGWDTMGNSTTAMSAYVIKKEEIKQVIVQDDGGSSGTYPFSHNYGYSRSMVLYSAAAMGNTSRKITTIALRVSAAANGSFPMKIWLKTVSASKTSWDATTDNIDWTILTQDATLLYDDDFYFDKTGWQDIPLSEVFNYNGTDNLVLMLEQNCGSSSCSAAGNMSNYPEFHYSTSFANTLWRKNTDYSPPSTGSDLSISSIRPD